MKSVKFRMIAIALLSATMPFTAKAQDKVEASVGADFVSNYIWRGTDCGGVSIQPSMGVSYKGLSLTAWGSVGIDKEDAREIDLTLGYNTGGFSVSVTDYWFSYHKEDGGYTGDYFKYGAHSTVHIFEATLGYDFGPLALSWNTYFAGDDYTKENGDRAYSTYVGISAPFKLGGLVGRSWSYPMGRCVCQQVQRNQPHTESRKRNQIHKFFFAAHLCTSDVQSTHAGCILRIRS